MTTVEPASPAEPASPTFENRPLNPLEQNMLHLDRVTNFSFVVIARINGTVDTGTLQHALETVRRQHYYLNVSIDLSGKPQFVVRPERSIPLRVITDADPMRWVREAEYELNTKFDLAQGPLARAVFITREHGGDLVIAFQHLTADGVSGVHFVREVVAACGQLMQGQVPATTARRGEPFPAPQWFPTSVFGIRGTLKLLAFLARFGVDAVRFSKAHFPPPEWVPFDRRDVRLTHHTFTQQQTERLVAGCRAAQTTVQGALEAALLLTLAQEIRTRAGVTAPVIQSVSSVNARPYCRVKIPDRHMGLWVGQVLKPHRLNPDVDFWTLARTSIRNLRHALASDMMFVPYRLLFRKVFTDAEAFTRLFENAKPYIEVTNIGRLSFEPTYGPLTLEQIHFASGLQFTQATPWGLTVATSTFAGQLLANFHYPAAYWDGDTAERVSHNVVARLMDALDAVDRHPAS